MTQTIVPKKKWGNIKKIEAWIKKEKDVKVVRRLNAIKFLMMGNSRNDTAKLLGVSKSSVKNWRKKWDECGLGGLQNNYKGSVSIVTDDMMADIGEVIEVKQTIDGKVITGHLLQGYLKKNIR